ncbi:hypothetical protein EGR_01608 [Echinococcus granulosus]|uniref:Uncharacterized protein n=1 Tax=Echinococcus granulosus TaxID=6210 RepID=W6USA8_ECHGR|nr:hypothetical protein EGR_01608 [Echinococcus granulosus]EUB63526.1 hypothetical protein EGR_01608 [Echinococcus granulosus]
MGVRKARGRLLNKRNSHDLLSCFYDLTNSGKSIRPGSSRRDFGHLAFIVRLLIRRTERRKLFQIFSTKFYAPIIQKLKREKKIGSRLEMAFNEILKDYFDPKASDEIVHKLHTIQAVLRCCGKNGGQDFIQMERPHPCGRAVSQYVRNFLAMPETSGRICLCKMFSLSRTNGYLFYRTFSKKNVNKNSE